MSVKSIFIFPGTTPVTITEVGGKALSLIQGSKEGLPVPPGCVLSVAFFSPWFQELQKTKVWSEFLQPNKFDLKKSCNELKIEALKLSFTSNQDKQLSEALQKYANNTLFAVRSSSPEEDLEGASFAGGYESILGVTQKTIKDAIRKAFSSCLDYRVTVYKKENRFNITEPKIAVIIQEQIASEVAGVGFSLNPVSNNYDEAVITANFGLGESVVQGITTPDTFWVNKITMHITSKKLGSKETSIWLLSNGGTKEKKDTKNNEFTLSDKQVLELTELIKKVEKLYGKPMDIEWAIAHEKLFLLQARPITSFIPVSSDLITNSEVPKRLYWDITTSVQGIDHPVSVMTTSFFQEVLKVIGKSIFNRDLSRTPATSPAIISNGRMYLNLSFLLLLIGHKRILSFLQQFDPLAAKALSAINEKEYILHSNKITLLPWKAGLKFPKIAYRIYEARRNPAQMHKQTKSQLGEFIAEVSEIAKKDIPFTTLTDELVSALLNHAIVRTIPLFIAAMIAKSEMTKLVGRENAAFLEEFDKALPNNVTTEMGLDLYHVSQVVPESLTKEQLLKEIETKNLPESFLATWQHFLEKYGFRGPEEIDLAAPRYQENPEMLLDILLTLKQSGVNTQKQFEENQRKRKAAFATVYEKILTHNPKQAKHVMSLYEIYETFAGFRESHKYYAVFVLGKLRQRILKEGRALYNAKRLASTDQVFDLTLQQLDECRKDTSLNLKELAIKNKQFINRLAKIPHLPTLFDSRGLIIRSKAKATKEGEVVGTPVSPGIAKGRIKVLHTPTEKPFLKGEILVARATDPGWTPLFVNASAVILEVGGVLQHGALVAREYGLPCVTGVENATTLWKDGTVVEVDGSEGIIRKIDK